VLLSMAEIASGIVLQIENKKRVHHHDLGKWNERNRQNKTQVSVRSCLRMIGYRWNTKIFTYKISIYDYVMIATPNFRIQIISKPRY
jgi:hypothetical protein